MALSILTVLFNFARPVMAQEQVQSPSPASAVALPQEADNVAADVLAENAASYDGGLWGVLAISLFLCVYAVINMLRSMSRSDPEHANAY